MTHAFRIVALLGYPINLSFMIARDKIKTKARDILTVFEMEIPGDSDRVSLLTSGRYVSFFITRLSPGNINTRDRTFGGALRM